MKELIRKRPVLVFVVATMILTYPVGIAALIGLQPLQDAMPGWVRDDFITGATSRFAPTIVALCLMGFAFGGGSFREWFRQLTRVNIDLRYYGGVFVVVVLGWAFASWAVVRHQGLDVPELLAADLNQSGFAWFGRVVDYVREVAYVTLTNGEETGWRFFLAAVLLVTLRPIAASLVIWMLWSIWHWPIVLLGGGGIELVAAFTVLLLPVSILAMWIYIRTESLFLLLVAHGVFNATTEYAFERQLPQISEIVAEHEGLATWCFAAVLALIAVVVVLIDRRRLFGREVRSGWISWAINDPGRLSRDGAGRGEPAAAGAGTALGSVD